MVLEACMRSADTRAEVLDVLREEHFYSDANRTVFQAAVALEEAGAEVSETSVVGWLSDRERLAGIGGRAYLFRLANEIPATFRIRPIAERLIEKWQLRRVIATCQRAAAEGYGDVGEVRAFLDEVEQSIFEVAHRSKASPTEHIADIAKSVFREIEAAAARGDRITGTSTGYARLDAKTSGLHPGQVWIIAGRPGMGKSAIGAGIAVNVAAPRAIIGPDGRPTDELTHGDGVLFCSLEMPKKDLAIRLVCAESRTDLSTIRNGCKVDWRPLTEASAFLTSLPLWIDEEPGITLLQLRAKVRRTQAMMARFANAPAGRTSKLGLVVVDYLQLMKGRPDAQSREQEVSEISRGLKELAKEMQVPIIALAQLNRDVEKRGKDKRPQLADLRESGSIEQDADVVIGMYRDEYYNRDRDSPLRGIAEAIILKQRQGPTGKVLLRYTANCTRFDNLAEGEGPPEDE
jgi:replicative DNA helicase